MKISIFTKTFFILLISFSLVFLASNIWSYQRFSDLYIEENINNVKSAIFTNAHLIENDVPLEDTSLMALSSETSFIRYKDGSITSSVGPVRLNEQDVFLFVLDIYDSKDAIKDEHLTYHAFLNIDVYEINYIYQFGLSDYLIISTRIQSLRHVDAVLLRLTTVESILTFIVILLLSLVLSYSISRPIKKIGLYAKKVSNLDFSQPLTIKRKDEFRHLVTALNEMTYNLKTSYQALQEANQKLAHDIDYEKVQEEKKKSLIMMINHEIKTPLSVMQGMIEGMIDGVGRYKDKDTYLKALLNEINAIKSLTQDLTYSLKLEDKMTKDGSTSSNVLLDVIEGLNAIAKQRHIHLNKMIDSTILAIDEPLLNILATNIIKNAIIYSKGLHVNISGIVRKQTFVFEVRNKGHLAIDDMNKLFDPFYRLEQDKHEKQGTGLGLSIVKQICQLYGFTYKLFNDQDEVVFKVTMKIKN